MLAATIRRLGDWHLAEECAADAFAAAAARWPREGVPDRPGAWLTTVAVNRGRDRLRRGRRGGELLEQIGRDPGRATVSPGAHEIADLENPGATAIPDDRLALIFTCCHPALALEARVALTLRMLGGLSTPEIARAFLVEEAAMAKRLTRAKAKIAAAAIPYRVPAEADLPDRLSGVLAVLYLMFNGGYLTAGGGQLVRVSLCEEAIRLTRILTDLWDRDGEPLGLLALMLFHHSRRATRVDAAGELVRLEDQDRSRWEAPMIAEAQRALERAHTLGPAGPYGLQAAIAGCHARAATAAATDWGQIAALYGQLARILDTPVVALNRAVAVALSGDLTGGLTRLDALDADGTLTGYHLLPAARADLLCRAGRDREAAAAYRRAIGEAPAGPERRFLQRRLATITAGGAARSPTH
ncbi:RNA polymerase sigma factor [Conexibacter sp. DBS9H8]|uniref:RNA polymerase sigma factor n=1 Tax=Conexibacter sp. DBS9H8 TaxID=2937801 RepID=UPI00200BD3C3|nr:DUF6596 domain-containing protein [Conexibacter sp. DBS9H8]